MDEMRSIFTQIYKLYYTIIPFSKIRQGKNINIIYCKHHQQAIVLQNAGISYVYNTFNIHTLYLCMNTSVT